jgi:hypothetical protein
MSLDIETSSHLQRAEILGNPMRWRVHLQAAGHL